MLPVLMGGLIVLGLGSWYMLGGARGPAASRGDQPGGLPPMGQSVDLPHIHGLGFSPDGRQILVPAHTGLRTFAEGAWRTPDVPAHDYMGFVATDDGFYSSGHPAPGSALPNPLGLVKSMDGGTTLSQLGFAGESDFHLMGVGYRNHTIYVLNPAPNARLGAGLYYSLDDGASWQQSTMNGISGQPIQTAVHPSEASIVALATDTGVFLSSDYGATFTRVGSDGLVTAAAFHPDGTRLFFGATVLSTYDLHTEQVTILPTPAITGRDALSNIAANAVQPDEVVIATFERNIFRTEDGGQSWQQLARSGTGITPPQSGRPGAV
jgi:hypothetical protein